MAIVESRLKDGTLTLGTAAPDMIDFSCQVTNARINSTYDDGTAASDVSFMTENTCRVIR